MNMFNFKALLSDVLVEKGKTFKDLENAGIICERSFYQYKDFTPYLPTVIKIANYLKVSLDYLSGRTSENRFVEYDLKRLSVYDNLIKIMKSADIDQSRLAKDLDIGRTNFVYWRKGRLPKLVTLVRLADYLNCNIDDLLYRI